MKEFSTYQQLVRIYSATRAEKPDVFGRRQATSNEVFRVLRPRSENDFYMLLQQYPPTDQDIQAKGDMRVGPLKTLSYLQRKHMRRIGRTGK